MVRASLKVAIRTRSSLTLGSTSRGPSRPACALEGLALPKIATGHGVCAQRFSD